MSEPDVSTDTLPNGMHITRTETNPIPYPLPEGDINSSAAWKDAKVQLADLGVSCWGDKISEYPIELIQSPALRAPEVCVGAGWGKPADIWSLGCMIYELVMGQPIIPANSEDHTVPLLHVVRFGDYPRGLVKQGKYSDLFFNEDGSAKIELPAQKPLSDSIRRRGSPDAELFIDFLQLMLRLDPAERASCSQLLAHEWLNSELVLPDVKPNNIMFDIDSDQVMHLIQGMPDIEASTDIGRGGFTITRYESCSIPFYLPKGDVNSAATWKDTKIKLADVGVSCWGDKTSEHFTDLIQSPALRAPEVCVGAGWGKPADIWNLGCIIYELVMGRPIIPADLMDDMVPLVQVVRFGNHPSDLLKRGKHSDVFFNKDGSAKVPLPDPMPLYEPILKNGSRNAELLADSLQLMLKLEPAERASCSQLLAHEWLNS
ncbi:uncharacterized protein FIBRA_07495 [Fibroporia radiculosa]|uniref:Protein kinase domain-containing protein n=1 Tax=Fibroporia radiculosa TaxID=599839 RepID=J4GEM8_9APHY|nr:uncharacterized protein FIBRA_07495 [Fibroporia radiculosa]CCM05283.1 predicted protein [Fibroporia radiculosa]